MLGRLGSLGGRGVASMARHPSDQPSRRWRGIIQRGNSRADGGASSSGAILAPMARAFVWGGWAVGGQSLAPFWVVSASMGKSPPLMGKSPPSMGKSPPSNGEISTFQWGVSGESMGKSPPSSGESMGKSPPSSGELCPKKYIRKEEFKKKARYICVNARMRGEEGEEGEGRARKGHRNKVV